MFPNRKEGLLFITFREAKYHLLCKHYRYIDNCGKLGSETLVLNPVLVTFHGKIKEKHILIMFVENLFDVVLSLFSES